MNERYLLADLREQHIALTYQWVVLTTRHIARVRAFLKGVSK